MTLKRLKRNSCKHALLHINIILGNYKTIGHHSISFVNRAFSTKSYQNSKLEIGSLYSDSSSHGKIFQLLWINILYCISYQGFCSGEIWKENNGQLIFLKYTKDLIGKATEQNLVVLIHSFIRFTHFIHYHFSAKVKYFSLEDDKDNFRFQISCKTFNIYISFPL